MKYFAVWCDYDYTYVEKFEDKVKLEEWYTQFMKSEYDYILVEIFYGVKVDLVESTTIYKVKE